MDECDIRYDEWKETISTIKGQLDVIWIASDAYGHRNILSGEDLSTYDDLTKFKLSTNLRNCKAIVDEAIQYNEREDEREAFNYTEGLKLPPDRLIFQTDSLQFTLIRLKKR